MKKTLSTLGLLILCLFWIQACSTVAVTTSDGNDPSDNAPEPPDPEVKTTPESFSQAVVQLNAFSLGSDYPPDIQIPDIEGMRSTAFVVIDGFSAKGVVPVDLDTMQFSDNFNGLDVAEEEIAGVINSRKVEILSATRALFLGVGTLVYFNPTTGNVLDIIPLTDPIELSDTLEWARDGDCDGDMSTDDPVGPGSFVPTGAEDLAVIGDRLFVTFNNGCFLSDFSSNYLQGIVRIFDIFPTTIEAHATPYLKLDQFNPTGLTVHEGQLIITVSGDYEYFGGPETPSSLVELDPETLQFTREVDLGLVTATFTPLAITQDGGRGFIGSALFSQVYEIDLDNFSVLRGKANPIQIYDIPSDYITDQRLAPGGQILFVASSAEDSVKAVDLSSEARNVLPGELDFLIPPSPADFTGAGPMAVRPGQPTVDYQGPDLFVLTSFPGTVSTAKTY